MIFRRQTMLIVLFLGVSVALADCVYSQAFDPGTPVYNSPSGNPYGVPPPPAPNWPPAATATQIPPGQPIYGAPVNDPLYQSAAASAYNASARPPVTSPVDKLIQSTWYSRVDYFHWNEHTGSTDFVNESGPLYTLGYVRRVGAERFRAELFGGSMHYDGYGQFSDDQDSWLEPLESKTRYLGCRGEYDYLIEPPWTPNVLFFLGIGSRFWIRDIRDGVTIYDNPVGGYQESWWTIYPYLGLETKWTMPNGVDIYTSTRVGATAYTYDHPSILDGGLYPRCGIMGQTELGLRGQHLSLSAYFEAMTWGHSTVSEDSFQPDSAMYTIGGRLGLIF